MDNVLNLDSYNKHDNISDDAYGNFVRSVKNKYGNRRPPLMVNTIDNFNNMDITVQAGGPSEDDVWFVFVPSQDALYIKPGKISLSGI